MECLRMFGMFSQNREPPPSEERRLGADCSEGRSQETEQMLTIGLVDEILYEVYGLYLFYVQW